MPFYTCGPNEVVVVSGCCLTKPYTLTGGRVYAIPGLHLVQRMSLNLMTVLITSPRIYTKLGVQLTVTGVAQVKISGANQQMLETACQLFLSKSQDEILAIVRETLESHQRSIIGMMTVEEIYKDRKKFSVAVFDVASSDLLNMGVIVVSYSIKDIKDDRNYLASLGLARIAQVKRDARIGEADAKRDASTKQSITQQQSAVRIYETNSEIAKAERDLHAQAAAYEQEVRTRKAQADCAYSLHAALMKQKIREAEMEIKIVERSQQIHVAVQETSRVERELDAQIRKPADAERYRMELLAGATCRARLIDAEARAEATRLCGEAQATAIDNRMRAQAAAMVAKAEAFAEYDEAGRLSLILTALPTIAHEVSAPLANCKRIALVANNEQIGAAKLTGEISEMITRLPKLVCSLTGYNMSPPPTAV